MTRARALSSALIDNVASLSRIFNRAICAQYKIIIQTLIKPVETTQQLIDQTDYVEKLSSGELLQLRVRVHTGRFMKLND